MTSKVDVSTRECYLFIEKWLKIWMKTQFEIILLSCLKQKEKGQTSKLFVIDNYSRRIAILAILNCKKLSWRKNLVVQDYRYCMVLHCTCIAPHFKRMTAVCLNCLRHLHNEGIKVDAWTISHCLWWFFVSFQSLCGENRDIFILRSGKINFCV